MPALADIATERLASLESACRLRRPRPANERVGALRLRRGGRDLVSFACNDYLGLTHHPAVIAAASEAVRHAGSGAAASRLVTGSLAMHARLEASLAAWKGYPAATLFGSGYLANLGAITALMGKGDLILLDRLAHACLLDAAQLSGARWMRFAHNDMNDLSRRLTEHRGSYHHCLIVTETVFSMDGDRAPLTDIASLATAHNTWWMVDDAHGLGETLPARPDLLTGTLSKALASYGGYAMAEAPVIALLQSTARPFVYSTALPPASVAAARAALDLLRAAPKWAEAARRYARQACQYLGLPEPESHIVPVILGSERTTLEAAQALEASGYLVAAIRPPTVPDGTARLRLSFSAGHCEAEVEGLCEALLRCCPDLATRRAA